MAFPRLGKLPPLQAIGRAANVDLDEPPDFGDESDVDNLIEEYENYERGYYYQEEHATAAAEAFSTLFKVFQPGNHICKCNSEGASSFTHCRKAVGFGQRYKVLKRNLENRAKLEFLRECTTRIQQTVNLINNVQNMVQAEYQTWHAICKSHLQSPPSTNLESLCAICEELRVQLNHWNSLKQTVLMDKWLRPLLPHITTELVLIRDKIFQIRNCALWWTDRLINIGLKVLAHCDPSQLSQEILWSVTRGLEEFNTIVNTVKGDKFSLLMNYYDSNNCYNPFLKRTFSSAIHINLHGNLLEGLKAVPFSRVLNILAQERSKYAAVMTHNFFTASEDLLLMLRAGSLPEYNWSEHKANKTRPSSAVESSDYYTQTGSNVSLGSAMLCVGSVTVPDLSKQDSAVSEFASREQEFAHKFLQIVNRSTKLLKRHKDSLNPVISMSRPGSARTNGTNTPPLKGRKGVGFNNVSLENFTSAHSQGTSILVAPAVNEDDDNISLCSLSSTLSTRKSVSWGDASELGILRQLKGKYMDMLWQHYEQEMMSFFMGHVVGGMSAGRTQLGNIMLCNDITVMMVTTMINQTCLKDIFPPGAVVPLYTLAKKLQAMTAWRAWDQEYSCALGTHLTDRCAATPLVNGEYSTKTAHRLRQAFQPLHSVIAALQLQSNISDKEKIARLQLVVPTLQKFILTSEFSLRWCVAKCDNFLSQWSVAPFLLVTQSDLKILSDEVRHVLYTSQPLCSSPKKNSRLASSSLSQQLDDLYQKLSDISAQLQTLSGSSVKRFAACCHNRSLEYFEEAMPQGKYWRKKLSSQNVPTSRSDYIEQGLQDLLHPVLLGISELKTTSQISAVSVAVTAMCNAWTQHILKQKIRFSYLGACQLELDFTYVREWLGSHLQDKESVHQSILSLDVFKYLTQAAQLLKQQPGAPGSRPSSNYSRSTISCSKSDTGMETTEMSSIPQELTINNSQGDQHRSRSPFRNGIENGQCEDPEDRGNKTPQLKSVSQVLEEEEHLYRMDNKEQWLALRVHGGSRNWPKLPNCFPSAN